MDQRSKLLVIGEPAIPNESPRHEMALFYEAGTPDGLFAPMLVLGAQSGLVLGSLVCRWFPYLAERPAAIAVVGMGAFFNAGLFLASPIPVRATSPETTADETSAISLKLV